MTLRNTMISLLLVTAISLSSWSILTSKVSKPDIIPEANNPPDAFMEDVVATIMNKEGTPSFKVTTPKMIHYASNDSTDIQKPNVIIFRQSPNPWHIKSDYAKATQGISQILFWSHVIIQHEADKENPTTTMQTDALTVYPEKQTARTDLAITITQPDAIVHATGMLADMNDGTVKLLSKAQGEYVPIS